MSRGACVPEFVRFLMASLLLTVTFGAGLGAVNLLRMTTALPLGELTPAAVRAHAYVQAFGFVPLFVMGVAYHVVPRLTGSPLPSPRLVRASFVFGVGGVSLAAGALLFAPAAAAPALVALGATGVMVASACFATSMAGALRNLDAFARHLLAGCAWLLVASAMAVAGALRDAPALESAAFQAALFGFAGSWVLGMSLRILPLFFGTKPATDATRGVSFWLFQAGIAATLVAPFGSGARAIAAALLLSSGACLVHELRVFAKTESPLRPDPFVRAAYGWLVVALVAGPGADVFFALTGTPPPVLVLGFARHAYGLGFLTQLIMVISMRVLPVFTGARLWSPRLATVSCWLLNTAVVLRALQVLVATPGWVALWPVVGLSGPVALSALVSYVAQIAMTMRGRRRAPEAAPTADPSLDELLAIPGAVDLLVGEGLLPRDRGLAAVAARALSLRQACRLRGLDPDAVMAALGGRRTHPLP